MFDPGNKALIKKKYIVIFCLLDNVSAYIRCPKEMLSARKEI